MQIKSNIIIYKKPPKTAATSMGTTARRVWGFSEPAALIPPVVYMYWKLMSDELKQLSRVIVSTSVMLSVNVMSTHCYLLVLLFRCV